MKQKNKLCLTLSIVMVGLCLRPSLTGIGSLLRLIKPDLGLTDTAAGLLTTIPMITFAIFSPFAGRLNNKIGTANTLFLGFSSIIVGILVRSYLGLPGLYLGTMLIGVGIAFGNVLMPAIIKAEFPARFGLITALNSAALAISSGVASGINYPLAVRGLGWRGTLCIWAAVALVGMAAWFPACHIQITARQGADGGKLLKSRLAWSVTVFLGIVALLFYSCMSWLSSIFQFKGLDAETAGFYVSAFQMMGILSSFMVPLWAGRKKDQRGVTFVILGIFLLGIITIALTDQPIMLLLGAILGGFACNGCFALSMAFIGFRSANGSEAAALSSMSQSIGYVIAAVGPLGMGFIYNISGNWNVNLWIMAALIGALFAAAAVCAKHETV